MNILYCRVSTIDQKTDRQKTSERKFNLVIEDKCSGSIPFFERPGGQEIMKFVKKGELTSLTVVTIDRLGRDLRDIVNTIHFFTEKKLPLHIISPTLSTIDELGKENHYAKMMINILGTVSEMEKNIIRERQLEGIKIAKAKGVYKGRISGSREDVLKFLSKSKNSKALDYLKKGYKNVEVAKITGLHINTITKIKKLGLVTTSD